MDWLEDDWSMFDEVLDYPMMECPQCGGSGGGADEALKCPLCRGAGEVEDRP